MDNPHADRWESYSAYTDPDDLGERQMLQAEAEYARQQEVVTCSLCGSNAYYKPGAGLYKCTGYDCGACRFLDRETDEYKWERVGYRRKQG